MSNGSARYQCPCCQYSTQDPTRMDAHKRTLRHDGNERRKSKVGTVTYGRKGKR